MQIGGWLSNIKTRQFCVQIIKSYVKWLDIQYGKNYSLTLRVNQRMNVEIEGNAFLTFFVRKEFIYVQIL